MPKPKKPPLLGCLTLLAASSAASLEPVYAASKTLPDDNLKADSENLNNAETSQAVETGAAIATHAQTINPESGNHPAFISRADVPTARVALTTNSDNNPSNKLQRLLQTTARGASQNSALLAARSTLGSDQLQVAATDTTVVNTINTDNKTDTTVVENTAVSVAVENAAVNIAVAPQPTVPEQLNEQLLETSTAPETSEPLADAEVAEQPLAEASMVTVAPQRELRNEPPLTASPTGLERTEPDTVEIAQIPIEPPLPGPSSDDADDIFDELFEESEKAQENSGYRASPAMTISNPSGFGADNRTAFIGLGYQERTRFSNEQDGGAVIGVGLGDARDNVGVQLSYTAASFGGSRDFGDGGFNVKLHKRLADDWSVALGWEGFITTADVVDFEDSIYGSVSHIIRTRESITDPFSRVALTAGVGSGRFRTEDDVFDDRDTVGVFGSMAVRVAEPVSAIVEWTGQDLAVGMSITPFKDVPLVLLPAVRDIAGAGDGGRFVLGAGFSFQF
ncbi:MAG: hypothetical protein AAF572_08485 [Cyanobacteria bacterium P01_B01_bin.77]